MSALKDRETGEYVASDWQKKDNYTDDSTVTDFIENIYDPKIEDIQNQIDGKIDTYYCDYEPANSNHQHLSGLQLTKDRSMLVTSSFGRTKVSLTAI